MNYIIKTKNLTKKYGKETSVNNLNLNIPKGAVYGFLGPNGAGKTTTMKMLLSLVHKTSGDIEILGKKLTDKNSLEILEHIGSLIETPSYYGHLSAKENLEITCILKKLPFSEIAEVLNIVNLENTANKPVAKFSLGMKQRLGIANALLGKPAILLLDEPTNGLDPQGIAEIRNLIKNLPQKMDTTVLISSHMLSEIEQIADFISIIDKGTVIFEGSLMKLKERQNPHLKIKTTDNEKALTLYDQLTLDHDTIICPQMSDELLIDMWKTLWKNSVFITRVFEDFKSLEQIFLEMTTDYEVHL